MHDLDSQTDENTTPTNAMKSTTVSPETKEKTNKKHANNEAGSESSTGKKQLVQVKIEKRVVIGVMYG